MGFFLGVDVGSVSAKFALLDEGGSLTNSIYVRTHGKPIAAIQEALKRLLEATPGDISILGVGVTGSARYLAGAIIGADVIKNEITCQTMGTLQDQPDVSTVIEIGGQDSKIIILRQGMVVDFGMNTVCAAGTGSFLDHQASRLNVNIEEFGARAVKSRRPVNVSGQCTVFAESNMIQKQQMGHAMEDILYGLCQALARNYLKDLGAGKEILTPIVFQGGVAFNSGMVRAFEELLKEKIVVPQHPELMGSVGAALLSMNRSGDHQETRFKGFDAVTAEYSIEVTECHACPTLCEIAQVVHAGQRLAYWGGQCDLWERANVTGITAS